MGVLGKAAKGLSQAAKKSAAADVLAMDQASRMDRAAKMGFDTSKTYYHGTKADIEAFDPLARGASTSAESAKQGYFFASDPGTASDYATLSKSRASLRSSAEEAAALKEMDSLLAEMKSKYGETQLNFGKGPVASWRDKANSEELRRYDDLVAKFGRIAKERPPEDIKSVTAALAADKEWSRLNNKYLSLQDKKNDAYDLLRQTEVRFGPESKEAKEAGASWQRIVDELKQAEKEVVPVQSRIVAQVLGEGGNVVPVKLKTKNPYIHDFEGRSYRDTSYSEIMAEAKAAGHDSVIFKNTYDPADPNNRVMQDIVAVFEPSQIRSVNAAFDPKKAKSGKILAGVGGVGILGAAALGGNNAEAAEPVKEGGTMSNADERSQLLRQARQKLERDQLLAAAKAKLAAQAKPAAPQGPGTAEKIETGARGVLAGMTAGLSEPIISGANALIQTGVDAALGGDIDQLSLSNIKEEYARDVNRRRELKEALPGTDVAGQVAGSLFPSSAAAKLAGVGAKVGGAAVQAIPKLAKIPVAGKIAVAAGQGAGAVLAQEAPQSAVERVTGFREADEGADLGEAAKSGAKFSAGLNVAGQAAGAAGKLGLGAVSALAGNVSPEKMKQYLDWKRAGGEDISMAVGKGRLDDAIEKARQEAQGMKGDFADAAVGAVGNLKKRVIQGSGEAYAILEAMPGRIPTETLKKSVEMAKKQVMGPVGVALGPTTKQSVAALDTLSKDLSSLPNEIDLVTAKSILQQLDDNIDWTRRAGDFGKAGNNAFKAIRSNLDAEVKVLSPEYAQKMQEVAKDAQMLDEVASRFGTPEEAARKIPSLISGKDIAQRQALEALDAKTGAGLGNMVSEIQKRESIAAMRPGQTEGFLKSIISDRSIENKQKLAMLAQVSEQNLQKMADDMAMSTLFDREFRAGSQHVNFWTVMGGLTLGGMIDESGMGMGGGAVLGVLTTKYGPRATKILLNNVAQLQGTPTVQKINRMTNLPEDMRRELRMALIRSVNTFRDYAPVHVPDDQKLAVGNDVQASSALSPMEKAMAINALSRNEAIDPAIMTKLVTGDSQAGVQLQRPGSLKPIQ